MAQTQAETLAANQAAFAGPAGPEALRIPAEPARLKQAGQQLGELADHLVRSGEHLTGADGRHQDRQGHTTSALTSVATWNGKRLGKDAVLLRELGGAVDHAAQVIGDLQAHDLPQLRRRWAQAQDQFLAEMRQAGNQDAQERQQAQEAADRQAQGQGQGQHQGQGQGQHQGRQGGAHAQELVAPVQPDQRPAMPNPHQLLQDLDDHLVQPYADLFRELGQHLAGGGGGGAEAFLADNRTEHAISSYRQTVRSVLEEFAELVRRVQQADRGIVERSEYPAQDKADDERAEGMALVGSEMVSGVESLRHLVQDLQDGAQATNQATERLGQIASALDDGRLPARGGQEHQRFGADWAQHFQRRTERLKTVCTRVDDVLEKFSRLDAECAQAIRAH